MAKGSSSSSSGKSSSSSSGKSSSVASKSSSSASKPAAGVSATTNKVTGKTTVTINTSVYKGAIPTSSGNYTVKTVSGSGGSSSSAPTQTTTPSNTNTGGSSSGPKETGMAGVTYSGKTITAAKPGILTTSQINSLKKAGYQVNVVMASGTYNANTGALVKGNSAATESEDNGANDETSEPVKVPKKVDATIQNDLNTKNLKKGDTYTIDTTKEGQPSREEIKALEAKGVKVIMATTDDIKKAEAAGITMQQYIAKQEAGEETKGNPLTAEGTESKNLNQSWAQVGKSKDPKAVSEFLNSQEGVKFDTRVEGDKIIGTRNGETKVWKNDGENWVVDEEATLAAKKDNLGEDAGQLDELGIDNPVLAEGVENVRNAFEEANKELVDGYEKKIADLTALYNEQDDQTKNQYADAWKTIQEAETAGKTSLAEIDRFNRDQFKASVDNIARKASGRTSALAAQMSAQGFDPSVIANLAGQVDTQYADERIKVAQAHIDNLQKTYDSYQSLYNQMLDNKMNLTAAERSFMENVATRMEGLKDDQLEIGKLAKEGYKPMTDLYSELLKASSTSAMSDATADGFEQSWKTGDESTKIKNLQSQLANYLGDKVDSSGKPIYNINGIPPDKLAEFAKLGTAREAYQAAVWYVSGGKSKGDDYEAQIAAAAKKTSTSTNSASVPANKAPAAATPTGDNGFDAAVQAALTQAGDLKKAGGFSKTGMSYDEYVALVRATKSPEELKVIQNKISAAVAATPALATSKALNDQLRTALGAYSNLTAEQKSVLNGTPGANTEVMKLVKEANAAYAKGDAKKLASSSAQLKKIIDAYLAGKQKGPFIQGSYGGGGYGVLGNIPANGGKSTTTNIPTTIVEA